jgi:hypothetical protein
MKKITIWIIIILLVIAIICILRFSLNGSEDNWIKDARGLYIKHGNPSSTPDYVAAQYDAIGCAFDLYENASAAGTNFNSQCLGACSDYAVDVVHVPRTSEDNLAENQCADYRSGKVSHFIELDKNGELVRIM